MYQDCREKYMKINILNYQGRQHFSKCQDYRKNRKDIIHGLFFYWQYENAFDANYLHKDPKDPTLQKCRFLSKSKILWFLFRIWIYIQTQNKTLRGQ